MSEKTRKQDRRTRYTRQTIKDTFLELLNQKSFTKIDSGYVNNCRSFILSKSKKLFLSVLSENTDGITIQGTVSG